MSSPEPVTHFYILLDRSGSMQSIADDVVGGLNTFVADQRDAGPDAKLTLSQFDGQDPQELTLHGDLIAGVPPLPNEVFQPRGNTPLFDATGLLAARAAEQQAVLKAAGEPAKDVIFVTVTDGQENASQEFTLEDVRRLVKEKEQHGWTFVYLSAAIDGYSDAAALGYDARPVQSWQADDRGAAMAFGSLSKAALNRRAKRAAGDEVSAADFFEGHKPAEDDRRRRGQGPRGSKS